MHELPPQARSSITATQPGSVSGALQLQRCHDCGSVNYPARELCGACLGERMQWETVDGAGTLLASSLLHHSLAPFFRARLPWRIGSVKLAAGPVAIVHLDPDLPQAARSVRVVTLACTGRAPCLLALAPESLRDAQGLEALIARLQLCEDSDHG
jgi:uncharacterized OB-fold protein